MYESVQQLGCGSPHHTFMRMAEIQDRHETDEQISIIKILVSVKLRTPSTSVKASNNDARVMKEKSNVPAQFLLVRRCFSNMSPREVVPLSTNHKFNVWQAAMHPTQLEKYTLYFPPANPPKPAVHVETYSRNVDKITRTESKAPSNLLSFLKIARHKEGQANVSKCIKMMADIRPTYVADPKTTHLIFQLVS
mmetsp:Transcript_10641/g.16136  ORF Transcript_10641/g.16136 Transcript_10641/m.16136 type:complete len:193 (+) Transcript_10641:241-819(+)